jgi:hypothetical protein
MTTERKSLLAIILARLSRGAVPVDGMDFWEPAGALKFTSREPPGTQKTCETAPRARATASYPACVQ